MSHSPGVTKRQWPEMRSVCLVTEAVESYRFIVTALSPVPSSHPAVRPLSSRPFRLPLFLLQSYLTPGPTSEDSPPTLIVRLSTPLNSNSHPISVSDRDVTRSIRPIWVSFGATPKEWEGSGGRRRRQRIKLQRRYPYPPSPLRPHPPRVLGSFVKSLVNVSLNVRFFSRGFYTAY